MPAIPSSIKMSVDTSARYRPTHEIETEICAEMNESCAKGAHTLSERCQCNAAQPPCTRSASCLCTAARRRGFKKFVVGVFWLLLLLLLFWGGFLGIIA